MAKRIYVGYVKEYNPKTGEGKIALSEESGTKTYPLPVSGVSFNLNDPICKIGTKVATGFKVNLEFDDKRLLGIYPLRG